jgi:hypothetical protein
MIPLDDAIIDQSTHAVARAVAFSREAGTLVATSRTLRERT